MISTCTTTPTSNIKLPPRVLARTTIAVALSWLPTRSRTSAAYPGMDAKTNVTRTLNALGLLTGPTPRLVRSSLKMVLIQIPVMSQANGCVMSEIQLMKDRI